MRIVICDDDNEILKTLEAFIIGYYKRKKMETPDVSKFLSAEAMLRADEAYDLAFLDVEMPGSSGISAIQDLRKRNKDLLVFIITSHETAYLDEALEEGIYRYMMKPINPLQLQVNLNAAMRRIGTKNKKITIETDQGIMSIDTDEIITVYTERRNTLVRTTTGTYKTSQSFHFWEEQLPELSFALSHKGVMLHLKYVRRVGEDLIEFTIPGDPAYLSVRNRAAFKKKFLQYMNSIN